MIVLFDSWYRDVNLLLSYSSKGLVHGNTACAFMPHQLIKNH